MIDRDVLHQRIHDVMWMDFPYENQASCERVSGKVADAVLALLVEEMETPKARRSDPGTSHDAARLIKARSGTARVRLLEAFGDARDLDFGITDEEAALLAKVSLSSEYATRCSELRAMGVIAFTGNVRRSQSGLDRGTSLLTDLGQSVILARRMREAS